MEKILLGTSPLLVRPMQYPVKTNRAWIPMVDTRKKNLSFNATIRNMQPCRSARSGQTDFSLSLSKRILTMEKHKNKNIVMSPLSFYLVFSLIAAGAKGPTLEKLLSFLKSNSVDQLTPLASELMSEVMADGSANGGPQLSAANGVWFDESLSLNSSFKQVAENVYKAACEQVDFQNQAEKVRDEVNSWVERETNGLIRNLFPIGSIDGLTKLIFANAVYFKGAWEDEFETSLTKNRNFHLLDGTTSSVPFMAKLKKQMISVHNGFKVLKLPYKKGGCDSRHLSMYIFLPDANDGLPDMVEKLRTDSEFFEHHLPLKKVRVGEFRIPKFKINFEYVSSLLRDMGLMISYIPPEDLSGIANSGLGQELLESNVIHKAFIEVDEKGTEAAAVTADMLCGCPMIVEKEVDFVADHPFMFLIRDDVSKAILFMGQVTNPLLH